MEKVRCLLFNSRLPKSLWTKAEVTFYFIINQSPLTIADKKTPEEVQSGAPANYDDLRICYCPTYAYVDNGNLELRSRKRVFLRYMSCVKGYKLQCPALRNVLLVII